MQFKERIKSIIPSMKDSHYHEIPKNQSLDFEIDTNGITFDELVKLSELLGTTLIYFRGNTNSYQLSEITWDTDYEGIIECQQVKFDN